jgi:hypothetical protein
MHLARVEDLMADHINNPERPERYEETNASHLPPNVLVNKQTRSNAFWAYMGPVIALFVVFAIAMLYWMNHHPATQPGNEGQTIGTSGQSAGERRDGGSDPAPRPDNTNDEINRRGGDGK